MLVVDGAEAEEVEVEEVFENDGNKFEAEVEVGYCDTEDILEIKLNKQSKQVNMCSHDLVTKF